IQAFANFGFAESHSLSFALLVYASSWLKLHYPAAFLAALLRAQPMGFYSPASLIADARRHGVEVLRPDIQRSGADASLEPLDGSRYDSAPLNRSASAHCLTRDQPPVPPFDRDAPFSTDDHRQDASHAVRLGLASVRGIGASVAASIVTERAERGEFRDMGDLVRRVGLSTSQLEALAAAGAFESFGLSTREALWQAGAAAQNRAEYLDGTTLTVQPPLFRLPSDAERLAGDLWATGVSTDDHPIRHTRDALTHRGVLTATDLTTAETGRRVEVAGLVTHRQRPATASGITFMNLEDETGLVNIVCSPGAWKRHRRTARESPALIVRGILERSPEGVINVVADRLEPLLVTAGTRSRDFQ
ncbi:MAG TPA: OB-fold nucleic acid binding domain-containing protein, partial [Terrimesophilobacter sp.]|nr:OB-fold nucleic acid binding domain-containing protein [Terrimesophilobacter sp.]